MSTVATQQQAAPRRKIVPTLVSEISVPATVDSHLESQRQSDKYEFSDKGRTLFTSLSCHHKHVVGEYVKSLAYHKQLHKRDLLGNHLTYQANCLIRDEELSAALHASGFLAVE